MLILSFVLCFLASLSITLFIENKSSFLGLIDKPRADKFHHREMPTCGGLAIIFSYSLYLIYLFESSILDKELLKIFLIFIPIILISLIDDIKNVKVYVRLIFHFLFAITIIFYFQYQFDIHSILIFNQKDIIIPIASVFLIVWLMNLYNFMDGSDGYAATQALFASFYASLLSFINSPDISYTLLQVGFFISILGFFIRNLPPAKIFMGDVGSITIGSFFGFLIIFTASNSVLSIYTWLILLSLFIVDASYTLLTRIVTKQNVTKPHNTHYFHKISKSYETNKTPLYYLMLINLFWIGPLAILSNVFKDFDVIIFFICYIPLTIFMIKIGAGLQDDTNFTK
tara:strand:+ start:289 stop:1314 length:1026 start_codon:yes stop_codon:yes gene_type:complete